MFTIWINHDTCFKTRSWVLSSLKPFRPNFLVAVLAVRSFQCSGGHVQKLTVIFGQQPPRTVGGLQISRSKTRIWCHFPDLKCLERLLEPKILKIHPGSNGIPPEKLYVRDLEQRFFFVEWWKFHASFYQSYLFNHISFTWFLNDWKNWRNDRIGHVMVTMPFWTFRSFDKILASHSQDV